jgi:hypothetical protein
MQAPAAECLAESSSNLVSLKDWNIMYVCMYEQLEDIPVNRGEIHEPRI